MRIYLDTSGWSAVHDARVPRSRFDAHEVLISSCVLDEIAIAGRCRAQQLARFAWAVSNRKKLREHIELTAAEYRAAIDSQGAACPFDTTDPYFQPAWKSIRTATMSEQAREQLQETIASAKRGFRDYLSGARQRFAPRDGPLTSDELYVEWRQMLHELGNEGWIGKMLGQLLAHEGFATDYSPHISYAELPCTACWVQYYLARSFLASYASRSKGRPDLGDQVDFRHACYAGVADVYVTNDAGMYDTLTLMVPARRARVVSPNELHPLL